MSAHVADDFIAGRFLLLFLGLDNALVLILLEADISLADQSFDLELKMCVSYESSVADYGMERT